MCYNLFQRRNYSPFVLIVAQHIVMYGVLYMRQEAVDEYTIKDISVNMKRRYNRKAKVKTANVAKKVSLKHTIRNGIAMSFEVMKITFFASILLQLFFNSLSAHVIDIALECFAYSVITFILAKIFSLTYRIFPVTYTLAMACILSGFVLSGFAIGVGVGMFGKDAILYVFHMFPVPVALLGGILIGMFLEHFRHTHAYEVSKKSLFTVQSGVSKGVKGTYNFIERVNLLNKMRDDD